MTIQERAEKAYPLTNEYSLASFNFGLMIERRAAYVEGATEQKEIDDKEMSDALFIQCQMLIEKACEYIMAHPTYAVQPEVYAEGLKKAMERG